MTTRLLQIYLIVTSVLAIAAILEPTLVVVGLFLGILPGLVLQLAPTGFLYGLVFAIILQFAIPAAWRPGVRSFAAFTATLAVFWALPQPGLWYAQKLLNESFRQDVTPAPDAPVDLSGHVRISNPDASTHCAALCTALLSTPGVTAFTIDTIFNDGQTSSEMLRLVPVAVAGNPVTLTEFGFEKDFLLRPSPPGTGTGWLNNARWRRPGYRESRVLLRSQTGSLTAPAAPLVSTYTGGMEYGHVGWSLRTFSYPAGSREPPNLDKLVLAHAGSSRM